MDNQHKLIKGYRDLSKDDINAMNAVKEAENKLGLLIKEMQDNIGSNLDQRWLAIGVTHLQQGFMAVVRSIAQPQSELNPKKRNFS